MFKKKHGKLLINLVLVILLSTVVLSARTEGFTTGTITLNPNDIIDPITHIPYLAGSDQTTYGNADASKVQRIEAKFTATGRTVSDVKSKVKQVTTSKMTVGPNTSKYTIYSFHDVDLGHSRSYFNQQHTYD